MWWVVFFRESVLILLMCWCRWVLSLVSRVRVNGVLFCNWCR